MTDKPTEASEWMHPDQLMKLHRLKMKKKVLQARMNKSSSNTENKSSIANKDLLNSSLPLANLKRKNPFAKSEPEKKLRTVPDVEAVQDDTLFELLHIKKDAPKEQSGTKNLSFSDVFNKLNNDAENEIPVVEVVVPGKKYIPMDWTLSSKMRIMSIKPFPWGGTCKTSEEASGTTGFVRCLDIGENVTLDTSPNARFHQCCLIWQHPSLPWLQLFPRTGNMGSTNSTGNSGINNQLFRDALYRDWCDSYRSLFHLLRAKQCPYFYFCANSFTVLFRAAGICGLPEMHALITPTTQGLRQSMKQEEIEFTMPLKGANKRHSGTDSGVDSNFSSSTSQDTESDLVNQDDDGDDDEDEEKWLESIGIDQKQIKLITNNKKLLAHRREGEVDNSKESLVFVSGVEVQGLFNFLLNCKSIITGSGALAGVPPTLLSPVAFHAATLRPIKVKSSIVRFENEKYYSLELKGPILPHVLPSLCNLMISSQMDQFTMSCAHVSTTKSFSITKHGKVNEQNGKEGSNTAPSVFGQEGLSDCGFTGHLLAHFCNTNADRIEVIESLKFSNDLYTWD